MTDKKPQIILTQLKEKQDRNGNTYFIGDLGMGTITMFKHKEKDGVWNVFMSQKEFKPKEDQKKPAHLFDDDTDVPF